MDYRSNWRNTNIAEVCEAIIDCVNRTAPVVTEPTPYKMLRTTNVKSGWIDVQSVRYVSEEIYRRWSRRGELRKGDVILTREAPLGEVGMIRDDDTVFMGQRLIMYRADPTQLAPHFLLYAMQEDYLQGQIRAFGSGATVEHMRVPDAKKLNILLPPIDIQRRIGKVLSAYDDLIENNTRRIRILERIARDLYQEWFVHFRFPGHEKAMLTPTELGDIPNTWQVLPIGQVIETVGGGTPSKAVPEYWENGDIVWFVPSDLTAATTMFMDDSGSHITELGLQKSSARLFPPYSVMMSSRATIGATAINSTEACTNQGFITCIPTQQISAYYLYFWIEQNLERIKQLATGATFREITKGTFRQIPIIVPDESVAQQFLEIITPAGSQLLNLQRRNQVLRETRDLLLPRLISGELDVSELDIDVLEPTAEYGA